MSLICTQLPFRHSTEVSNHYAIAWTYVTLVIAIVSLLYPLSLNIRDSLTTRLINSYDKLIENGNGELKKKELDIIFKEPIERVAELRFWVFDKQLPFLIAFAATSVVRVLLCLIGLGWYGLDDRFESQLLEPQLYVIVYLAWMIWVSATILILQPFKFLEKLEMSTRELPDFEKIVKPYL